MSSLTTSQWASTISGYLARVFVLWTPEGSLCLLFKEKAERSMSLPYGDAETDRVISSPVKGATRARNLVVECMIEGIRVDLQ
jgi:hypothetical protein